mgnify:CR=1
MAKLGELYKITSGGTPSRTHSEYYEDGTIPWVKTGDLKDKYLFETDEKISQLGLENSSARIYLKNTVLLAMYGATIGATSILEIDAATNQACAAFSPREDVLPEYLYAFLESQKDKFIKDAVGGAQPNLSAGYLKNIDFDYPPLEQQTKITRTLSQIDELLFLRKKQLEKLDELVKARFVEMFGDPFEKPKWPLKKLKNFSENISDGSNIDKAYYQKNGDVLFLRIQNVWSNEFRLEDSVYISTSVNEKYRSTLLRTGDLLITKIGRYYTKDSSLGRVAVYRGQDGGANYSNNIMGVTLTKDVLSEYVNILMNLNSYKQYIRKVSVGGTDKRALSKTIIEDFPIIVPPMKNQNQFAAFVERVDQQKQTVQQSLEKLELMKRALMQEYFG